jgi:hypothetical protein
MLFGLGVFALIGTLIGVSPLDSSGAAKPVEIAEPADSGVADPIAPVSAAPIAAESILADPVPVAPIEAAPAPDPEAKVETEAKVESKFSKTFRRD